MFIQTSLVVFMKGLTCYSHSFGLPSLIDCSKKNLSTVNLDLYFLQFIGSWITLYYYLYFSCDNINLFHIHKNLIDINFKYISISMNRKYGRYLCFHFPLLRCVFFVFLKLFKGQRSFEGTVKEIKSILR